MERYIPYIIIGVVILAFIGYVLYSVKKKGLKKAALEWILLAESEFQKGQNDAKFAFVYHSLYNLLPAVIKVFISEDVAKNILSKFIQDVFDYIKPALDYGIEEVVIDNETQE